MRLQQKRPPPFLLSLLLSLLLCTVLRHFAVLLDAFALVEVLVASLGGEVAFGCVAPHLAPDARAHTEDPHREEADESECAAAVLAHVSLVFLFLRRLLGIPILQSWN